jgi:hypothetical protein
MGHTDLLEDKLKTCPLDGEVPQITPQQYQRFVTAVRQAAELAPAMLEGQGPGEPSGSARGDEEDVPL